MIKKCITCGKKFKTYYPDRKLCSRKCYRISDITKLKIKNTLSKHHRYNCLICNKIIEDSPASNRKYCSRLCFYNSRVGKKHSYERKQKTTGKNNYAWKDNNVGYSALHSWVKRKLGKPLICQYCRATSKERKISWANIDHKYKRKLNDFIPLCYSCHRKYDYKYNLKSDNTIGNNQYTKLN